MNTGPANPIEIQLFISTDDENCTAVKDYLETWFLDQSDNISLEIIPILEYPVRLIQAGINYTPALIINGKIISQNCSLGVAKTFLDSISNNQD